MLYEATLQAAMTSPADCNQNEDDCPGIGEPVQYIAISVQERNCLDDLDEGAEQRQSDEQYEKRRCGVREAGQKRKGRKGRDVLELVVGITGNLRRMRQHGHDESKGRRRPKQIFCHAGAAPLFKGQSVTTSLPDARRCLRAAIASPARSSG